jgi:glutamyl-tRNA synthetase
MTHKNPAMRDFPLARVNLTKHPLQKNKYRVWPLMNLAVPVDDIEMKMTHIIRAKEHRDNAQRQEMIFNALGKKYPWAAFVGRYKFKDMELSATKITQGIKSKKYKGWSDPRLPTIQALKKKYKPEAFWRLAEHRGLSEVDKVIDKKDFFKLLDEFNKE